MDDREVIRTVDLDEETLSAIAKAKPGDASKRAGRLIKAAELFKRTP